MRNNISKIYQQAAFIQAQRLVCLMLFLEYAKRVAESINTNEGITEKVEANVSIVNALPIIATSPSYIDTGLVRGSQKIYTFDIKNTGLETLKNARLEGPSTSWLSLTVDKNIGDIGVNQSKSVGIAVKPGEDVQQGVYNDKIVIYSDNHIPYTYNIQVTITSNAVGNVLFDVLNELMEDVSGATITFQHQTLTELLYNLKTAADGTVGQFDIPEGRYTFNISATGHKPTSGTFTITPGITTTVPIALELNMVSIEWSVVPTTIQDKYEIKISQTFETNVPAPVLITEPPSITLPEMQPGQVFNGEYTVTNYGLIAVDNVKIDFPTSFGEYDIEILTSTIPKRIGAMQKITVPYRITRRLQTTANFPLYQRGIEGDLATYAPFDDVSPLTSHASQIFDEVQGYGGGGCLTSFTVKTTGTAVICPNTPQQRTVEKDTYYTIGVPVACSSGNTSVGGSYVYTGGSGTGSQTGSGGTVGGTPSPINTGNPCDCKKECDKCDPGDSKKVCMNRSCTRVDLNSVTATVNGVKEVHVELLEDVEFIASPVGENCEYQYSWSLGDGTGSSQPVVTHAYRVPGTYTAEVKVWCKKCSPPEVKDTVKVVVDLGICQEQTGEYKPDGSVANDGEQCCSDGQGIPNAPIADLDQCPNRVQKPGYNPWDHVNGCGGAGLTSIFSDNPMWDYNNLDPIYTSLHGPSDGRFLDACNAHDACYGNCNSEKPGCDVTFGDALQSICYRDYTGSVIDILYRAQCLRYAAEYEAAVTWFGGSLFNDAQKEGCNCCYR